MYIVLGVGGGLILILLGISIYLLTTLTSLKKKIKKEEEEEDNDSINENESTRQTINNQPYNQHVYEHGVNDVNESPFYINPHNPSETYQIK